MAGNEIRKTLCDTPYTYDVSDHCSGTFASFRAPSHVEFANHNTESHRHALRLKHPNYIAVNAVHLSNDNESKGDIFIHEKPECTYLEQINHLSRSNPQILPVLTYNVVKDKARYEYVPEEFRYFLRGAVNLISRIHHDGHALLSTTLFDNLWCGRGELIICGVEFEDVASGAKYTRFREDWVQVAKLKRHLFANYRNSVSAYLDSLIHAMRSYRWPLDEKIIVNHLSIMSNRERIAFIEMFSEKKDSMVSMGYKRGYDRALCEMGNFADWKNKSTMRPRHRIFKSVESCYKGGAPGSYYDAKHCKLTNADFLRCSRNIATHLKDILKNSGTIFGDNDVDNMIMSTFSKPLLTFHIRLGHANLLEPIL